MADEEKENGQAIEETKPLSVFEEKMKILLDELDKMGQIKEALVVLDLEIETALIMIMD